MVQVTAEHKQRTGLLTIQQICRRGQWSESFFHRLVIEGRFPRARVKIGRRFSRWAVDEVEEWFDDPAGWLAKHGAAVEVQV